MLAEGCKVLNFVRPNALHFTFANEPFDMTFCSQTFSHICESVDVLREFLWVARKNLILLAPSMLDRVAHRDSSHRIHLTPYALEFMWGQAGFRSVKIHSARTWVEVSSLILRKALGATSILLPKN
jgi:hypothetical protein